MTVLRSFLASTLLALCLLTLPALVYAQQSSFSYDDRTLAQLFEALEKKDGVDAYIEKRIADERVRIRKLADTAVQGIVAAADPVDGADVTALPKSLDRQRALVTLLNENLRDRKVDLDLLLAEEKKYYTPPISGTGSATDTLRLTQSNADLQAKKAVLEERINALTSGLSLEEDRLNKLNWEQWVDQFQNLFGVLKYVFIILGAVIIDRLLRRRVAGRIETKGRRYLVSKLITASIYTVAFLVVLSNLLSDHPQALASLAIVGAGIAVALQDVVKDIMGWIVIMQRRLFTLGNRVSIGLYTGDVIDIGPLRTTMLEVSINGEYKAHERTGKTLYVPNSLVLRESVLNYNTTSDYMGIEMLVTVTYGSNWHKAEVILLDVLTAETKEYIEQARTQQRRRTALFYTMWEIGDPEVHVDLESNGVLFTLKCTVPIGMRRRVITKLTRTILDTFSAEPDIDFAYNTIQVVGDLKKMH